jgi:CRP/FNR family transcriptional regulator, anaerobic regulatory protein
MTWFAALNLETKSQAALAALPHRVVPGGSTLFHAGDTAQAFVVVLRGLVEVSLVGASGREILLYSVAPGQSCIQTTLGLMGDEAYSGEAVTVGEVDLVLIPRPLFLRLMDDDAGFRAFVLRAFGRRMADLTRVLEQVAFGRVEQRLAAALLDLARNNLVEATQGELAARIGTAREVVSRRLEAFAREGITANERGHVRLLQPDALRQRAAPDL